MNISEPFVKRPVATSLLMVGVLLVGLLGYHLLPISALPPVDFPTIQVVAQYPGASPDVMASSVTTPLERQFGQISGLATMTSVSSFGQRDHHAAVRPRPQHRCCFAGRAGRHQRRSRCSADGHAQPAYLQQSQSRRHAYPHARAHVRHAAAWKKSTTSPTPCWRRNSAKSAASAW